MFSLVFLLTVEGVCVWKWVHTSVNVRVRGGLEPIPDVCPGRWKRSGRQQGD